MTTKTIIAIDKSGDGETILGFRNGDEFQMIRGQIAKDVIAQLENGAKQKAKLVEALGELFEASKLLGKLFDDNKVKIPYTPDFVKFQGIGAKVQKLLEESNNG